VKEYLTHIDPERWVDSDMTRDAYIHITAYVVTCVAAVIGVVWLFFKIAL
jgi:hypothetical protein